MIENINEIISFIKDADDSEQFPSGKKTPPAKAPVNSGSKAPNVVEIPEINIGGNSDDPSESFPSGKQPEPNSITKSVPNTTSKPIGNSQKPSGIKSAPVSTDIKSKIIELQQAILDFKNVAQSTDFGSFGTTVQDPFSRNLDPEQEAKDKDLAELIKHIQSNIDMEERNPKKTPEDINHIEYLKERKTALTSQIGLGQKSLQGYKPMNDFFLQKYMEPVIGGATVWKKNPGSIAEQYVQVEMPTAQRGMKGSGAVNPIDFKGIIETIGRIGTPKTSWRPDGEKVPDGIFDIRTYNAIANIYVVTNAFVNIAKDFGMTINDKLIGNFKSMLTVTPDTFKKLPDVGGKGIPDKSANLSAFTRYIRESTEVLKAVKKQILDNPAYKEIMSQTKSLGKILSDKSKSVEPIKFEKIEKGQVVDDTDLENYYKINKATFNSRFFGTLANFDKKEIFVTYNSLSSIDNLKALYNEYFPNIKPTTEILNKFLDSIKSSVEK